MYRAIIISAALSVFISSETLTQPESAARADNKAADPTITVTTLDINDKTLSLNYEIMNNSKHDIWICEDIAVFTEDYDFEVFIANDNQTLQTSRCFEINIPGESINPHYGRYIRLQPGKTRTESLLLPLPIHSRILNRGLRFRDNIFTKRLLLEIGYYSGDIPDIILGIPEKSASIDKRRWSVDFLASNWLNSLSTNSRHAGEEIIIPWIPKRFLGEQVLQIRLDRVKLPYKFNYSFPEFSPPKIQNCTRLEIHFEPSALEYFFPYPTERVLFSNKETEHLQSLETIVLEDKEAIEAFAVEVGESLPGGIITKQSTAHVNCYYENKKITSFTIYDDVSIVTEDKERLRSKIGLLGPDTPIKQIRPFQLRLECADNLKKLWLLLTFLFRNSSTYPISTWCNTIVQDHRIDDSRAEIWYKCPTAGPGKCHYAMNPNCKPDSSPDTVLLFETKAGWNQNGGPELFTFDNHDPKGGCVLLNDGTVKFIRTREELRQLRW